ncbi:DegT/DnrJ/EryC1/StrS aminotransferase family protein [Nostocoides sp. HKS02]|uniref:DegT/DnrJ/EryC1/StrS family aminotransferase n=1 Tax=Nostocoides sp. HKS02 TaxID=1813880 RepID=UPI0012B45E22|nr:DegT/DnrJ/EryC1/StrS family aminotransferase [Tetrasphaera sp. HKS02]QGN59144.1 aminotransferase class V-fold PLP-dependent enzyme [Tetrasphaera sp. HKS02]
MTTVPLVDLAVQHAQVAEEVEAGFAEVLAAGDFIAGKSVAAFEQEYAEFVGARSCVGVANGTDALELALRALGVGPGDEVVVPANSFIATAEAVVRAGARPVFTDVDDDALLIDPALVERTITARTRAVIPVDLYGQVAPTEQFSALLEERGIAVIEDGAQSQGATRFGRSAGTFGALAATSFYPGKNLGAYGDAGAVLTDDDDLAQLVRLLGAHGSPSKYRHTHIGFNSRLDTLQAVVLRAKLRRLAQWNDQRRAAAVRYDHLLAGADHVRLPQTLPGNEHVWHLYVVRVDRRDEVLRHLQAEGVGAGVHYPVPIHLTPAMAGLGYGLGRFPVTERAAEQILSLPLFPGITAAQQDRVVEVLLEAVRHGSA